MPGQGRGAPAERRAGAPPPRPPHHEVLLTAALTVARERDEGAILEAIIDAALTVTDARYAALAQYDDAGDAVRFLQRGMSDDLVSRIGRPPRGSGLLSVTAMADGPIRVTDIERHPGYVGLPPGHPRLTSFLGVPIRSGGRRHGNLYVAHDDQSTFEAADEWALTTLAAFASCAIDGAQLVTVERERGEALAQAAAAQERTRRHSVTLAAILTAQEEERARVARDLHDEIGQSLTGILLGLHLLEKGVHAAPWDRDAVDQRISDMRALVSDALTEVRRMAAGLRPTVLDDLGLAAAVARLVADLGDHDGIVIELEQEYSHPEGDEVGGHQPPHNVGPVDRSSTDAPQVAVPPIGRLPAPVETVVYRVVQEALTNVVRHSGARRVVVRILAGYGQVAATITDDGRGFQVEEHAASLGLRGMIERAALVGGTLDVTSGSWGTTVALHIPLERPV